MLVYRHDLNTFIIFPLQRPGTNKFVPSTIGGKYQGIRKPQKGTERLREAL